MRVDDAVLVERAKTGDHSAFNELVRRHRSKAFGVARSYSRDRHLAEDIVQEAFMRAFLHVSSLTNAEKFVPWLNKIVRNQAHTRMRGGGPFGKERPFSSYVPETGERDSEWGSVEGHLNHMAELSDRHRAGDEPLNELIHRELVHSIRQMVSALKPHERRIVEAHFYRQMGPSEIAGLYSISPDQVYKTISRSRAKLKDARFRMYLQEYLYNGKETGHPESLQLALGKETQARTLVSKEGHGSSFAFSVYRILRHCYAAELSFPEVMGLTGQAFRLNVETARIDASGPTTYFWEPVFEAGLESLGISCSHTGDGGLPPSPFALSLGLAHMKSSLASGRPVLAWDLFGPGFDLITGYDDKEMFIHADNGNKQKTIPYESLGQGSTGGLFVCSLDRLKEMPFTESLRYAIRQVRKHAQGELGFLGYTSGLAAYQAWIRAFENGQIDEVGNAYTASVAADARRHAVHFLEIVQTKLTGVSEKFARQATACYQDSADFLRRMTVLFPFPGGGMPHDPVFRNQAIWLLNEAHAAEINGLNWLEKLSRSIEKK